MARNSCRDTGRCNNNDVLTTDDDLHKDKEMVTRRQETVSAEARPHREFPLK
jgi:hypothetical protein